jgi:predicted ATPase
MKEQKAKKYTNDEVTINILPQYSYEYIIEKIDLLKTLLPDEKFNEIFTKQYKVNRNVLKGIRT